MERTYLKYFLICMFKNPNLADILINLADKKREKKLNSAEFMEFVFSKSGYREQYIRYWVEYRGAWYNTEGK